MGKYRIIRHQQAEAELYGGEQYWQELHKEQAAELDLDEIRELNQMPEQMPEETPRNAPWPVRAALLVMLAAFIMLFSLNVLPYLRMPDLSFLSRSAELAQNEALVSLKSAVVSIEGARASGSGFNLRADGLIVTNRHVVENNPATSVIFADGSRYLAREWQYVEGYDLALAVIRGKDLPYVQLATDTPQAGDNLIFIGNPLGFDWTISEAQMLAEIDFEGDTIIYFAGPVRSGSSGSPLFNAAGQVVGVIFASLRDVADSGLAIPGSLLLSYYAE